MSVDKVREYLKQWGRDQDVMEFESSSATVEMAALAVGVEPSRIAKTLSFQHGEGAMVIVAAGDAKIDNSKFKQEYGFKARMLSYDEVLQKIGYAPGGVCPFGLTEETGVYLDSSLKRFTTVYPACGSSNSAIELTCDELERFSKCRKWVDVCKDWTRAE